VTQENIYKLFLLAQHLYLHSTQGSAIDTDLLKRYMQIINVITPRADNGMFVVDVVDEGGFSREMLDLIDRYINTMCENCSEQIKKNTKQLIISQLKEPDRIFDRLIGKNIPKSDKIRKFLSDKQILAPEEEKWLMDGVKITNIIEGFIKELHKLAQNKFDSIVPEIDRISNVIDIVEAHLVLVDGFIKNKNGTFRDLQLQVQQSFMEDIMNSIFVNDRFDDNTCTYKQSNRPIPEGKLADPVSKGYQSNIRKLLQCYRKKYVVSIDEFIEQIIMLFININIPRLGGKYSEFGEKSKQLILQMAPSMTDRVRKIVIQILQSNTKVKGPKSAVSGFFLVMLKSKEYIDRYR
jgi:hypothetical protein